MDTNPRKTHLESRLEVVRARIAAHPVNRPQMQRAREYVKEHNALPRRQLAQQLREQGLPSMSRQSLTLIVGLPGLARLNRQRLDLERQSTVGQQGSGQEAQPNTDGGH